MQYGLYFPNFGRFGDPDLVVEMAVRAEEAGWDGIFPWDHIQIGHWAGPVLDPWITLAAIAAATERVRLGPMVTPLARRRPSKLARETVTLDHLSKGRLVLGVGLGAPSDVDFANFGDALEDRVRAEQLDEGLDLLASLWTGEVVNHDGVHHRAIDAKFLPTPAQRPRIPIWVGGMWPKKPAFRRAARWDGVCPIMAPDEDGGYVPMTPGRITEIIAFVRSQRATSDPFDVAVIGSSFPAYEDDPPADFAAVGATWWMESLGFPTEIPLDAWLDHVAAGPPRS
jgi:alkanesulfonate monooxygenase SsuD/methylene tetrahydromethanopterin reductase-like flavin-dependent oxidoreductase (luciferase family)